MVPLKNFPWIIILFFYFVVIVDEENIIYLIGETNYHLLYHHVLVSI